MNPRTPLTIALATAVVGTGAAGPVPAGAAEPELVERCYVEGLTVAEVEAGEESDVWCVAVEADAPMTRRGTSLLAILYEHGSYNGRELLLEGTTCDGLAINWGAAHWWNDKVSSTDLVVCGSAKHHKDSGFTGAHTTLAGTGQHTFLGTSFDETTSSITYAP